MVSPERRNLAEARATEVADSQQRSWLWVRKYLEREAGHLPLVVPVHASSVPDVVTVAPRVDVAFVHAGLGNEPLLAAAGRNATLADAKALPIVETGVGVSHVVGQRPGRLRSATGVVGPGGALRPGEVHFVGVPVVIVPGPVNSTTEAPISRSENRVFQATVK
eukprot:COSAG02_NODE_556_length_20390_cov_88.575230_10_plen_164_part_00